MSVFYGAPQNLAWSCCLRKNNGALNHNRVHKFHQPQLTAGIFLEDWKRHSYFLDSHDEFDLDGLELRLHEASMSLNSDENKNFHCIRMLIPRWAQKEGPAV